MVLKYFNYYCFKNILIKIFLLCVIMFQALHYLVLISEVDEVEIFKICLEYWNGLAAELYRENPFSPQSAMIMHSKLNSAIPPRRLFYAPVLTKVCKKFCFICNYNIMF